MKKSVVRGSFGWLKRPQIRLGMLTVALLFLGIMTLPVAPLTQRHAKIIRSAILDTADCRHVACIALTFDDGPNAKTTAQILDTLEREHVSATFFVIGSRIAPNARLIQRMHQDGFEIGNHSWTHPDLTMLKPKQIRAQIEQTQVAIEHAGAPAPTLFRPPYGYSDSKLHRNISLTFMFWNEDPRDWAAHSAKQVAHAVLTAARPGGVIDMHDIYKVTADALPHVIHNLKARHYHFVTASQLLDLHPGQKGEFYGRLPPKGQIP
jgi:peptidoglycan/xylan/chitin deacetylase (PgdA/CDA1 family)